MMNVLEDSVIKRIARIATYTQNRLVSGLNQDVTSESVLRNQLQTNLGWAYTSATLNFGKQIPIAEATAEVMGSGNRIFKVASV